VTAAVLSFTEHDSAGAALPRQGIPNPGGKYAPAVTLDGTIPTYSWSAANITPVATPYAFLRIKPPTVSGVTLRIRSIRIGGVAGTPGGMSAAINRCSTLGTDAGGTVWTPITPCKRVTGDGAPTSVISYLQTAALSAEPTLVATAATGVMFLTDGSLPLIEFDRAFGQGGDEALVVGGSGDYIFIDLGGSTVPMGGQLFVEVVGQEV
jgi:hypothetical protein